MTQTKAELLQTRHQGDIRLGDADSSHYVGFKAPATVGSNLVWTLPATDGTAGYYLKTDGSGNLGWSLDNSGVSLSGSTNNTIATVTGANALQGEANLTFDGNSLSQAIDNSGEGIRITASGNHWSLLKFDSNVSSAGGSLCNIQGHWNGTEVANIIFAAGDDTTNKDDGIIKFNTTTSGGSSAERLRIDSFGRLLLGTQKTYGDASYYDDITINNSNGSGASGGTGITLISDSGSWGALLFGDEDDNDVGAIKYDHNSNSMQLTINASERFRIASSGQFGIGGSNYGTSGQVLTSGGSGAAVSWTTISGGVSSDAQQNTVAGTNAGDSFTGTDATNNTLFGYNAGTAITSGDSNSVFGRNSGQSINTGSSNIAVGNYSLGACTTGSNNIGIGEQCLTGDLTTASFNVAIGNRAGYGVTSGEKCVFLGDYSGYASTTGHGNIGIGDQTMGQAAAVTGHYNIGIGTRAFKGDGGAISGNYNIAIGGKAAQRQHSSVTENISIGMEAGRGGSSNGLYGGYNVFIGSYAGHVLESGQINTCVGRSAGADLTTGGQNLLLGYQAGLVNSPSGQITTGSYSVCLGDNNITNLYCADTSISSSDKRDKTDVTDFTHGLKWINQLKPVTYRWDKRTWYNEYNENGSVKSTATPDGSKKKARQHIGFLAQDVLAIEQADGYASKKDDMLVVNLNEDDTAYGLKYERLVPVLVNAVKELATKVAALEAA